MYVCIVMLSVTESVVLSTILLKFPSYPCPAPAPPTHASMQSTLSFSMRCSRKKEQLRRSRKQLVLRNSKSHGHRRM